MRNTLFEIKDIPKELRKYFHEVEVDCGSPWIRIIERVDTGKTQKMADGWDAGNGSHGTIHRDGREKGETGKPVTESKTIGWRPGCKCGIEETEPCVVMDIFGGAMTTAVVAERYRRKWIMIELSESYIKEIGIPRIKAETQQLKWC